MKIFGVGLNRTGTLTLSHALSHMGFRSQHWAALNYKLFRTQKYDELCEVADAFDALTDWPWPLMVGKLIERYGEEARFVLTTRADPDIWLRSLARHATRKDDRAARKVRKALFGAAHPNSDPEHHKQLYINHNAAIRGFFKRSGRSHQLLEVCWDRGDGWEQLSPFVGHEVPAIPFPHRNNTSRRTNSGFVGNSISELGASAAFVMPERKAG